MRWLQRGKPFLWMLLLAVVCFGLQLGAFQALSIHSVGPDLILALIVSVSLCQGPVWGIFLALALGLMADSLTGWGLGLNMLCYVLTAGLCGLYELRLHADAPWLSPALSAGAVLMSKLVNFAVMYISRVAVPVTGALFYRLAVTILLTGAASLVIHLILYRRLQPAVEDTFARNFRTYR